MHMMEQNLANNFLYVINYGNRVPIDTAIIRLDWHYSPYQGLKKFHLFLQQVMKQRRAVNSIYNFIN